jgi:hypothetical protein
MVEEVPGVRVEVIAVKRPAAKRNRYPELTFFVPFSPQRRESKAVESGGA